MSTSASNVSPSRSSAKRKPKPKIPDEWKDIRDFVREFNRRADEIINRGEKMRRQ